MLVQILNEVSVETTFESIDKFPLRFFLPIGINFIAILILFRLVYYPLYRNRENVFTFFIFNTIIFLVTYMLNRVEMSMGAAFGLFAVFSMLRFRTENISTKDMTYMFLAISLGLINAINKGGWKELICINMLIISITYLLESNLFLKKETTKTIVYDTIELIKPESRVELIADLEKRIGKKINSISMGDIDFLRDSVIIKISYYENTPKPQ